MAYDEYGNYYPDPAPPAPEYNSVGDWYRITSSNPQRFWGGAGAPHQYDFYKDTDPTPAFNWAIQDPGEHDESGRSFWAGLTSSQYSEAARKSEADRTALERARLSTPGAIGQALIRPDLVGLNPYGMTGAELAFYSHDQNLMNSLSGQYTPEMRAAIQQQISRSTPQAQDDGDGGLFGDLAPLILAGAGLYFGLPALGEALGGAGVLGGEAALAGSAAKGMALGSGISTGGGLGITGAGGTGLTGSIAGLGSVGTGGAITSAGLLGSGLTAGGIAGATGLLSGIGGAAETAALGSGVSSTASGVTGLTGSATGSLTAGNLGALGSTTGAAGLTGTIPGIGTLTAAGMLIPASGGAAIPLASASPSILTSVANWASNLLGTPISGAQIAGGALNAVGGLLSGNAQQEAAQTTANAQLEAARIAADAAKFKPIGITTRFGQSNFQKDAQGNVIGANYTLTPDIKAQQDALMGVSGNMLTQYQNAPGQFAPMGDAGQRAMTLGNQYLAADPQAQAMKYMQDQQALLATGRERDMNQMLTGEFNRGTYGLATGGTSTGMGAANPRLEAMLNAQRQQDLGLAAQATQGGMDYAKFGAGMVGTGGDLTRGMFSGQTAAYDLYKTALGGAQYIEGLGQQPLTMGIDIGKQTSNAASGGLLAQGMNNAAQTMQPANAYSPWGTALMNAGGSVANYQQQDQLQQQQAQQQAFQNAIIAKQFGMVSGGI